MYDKLIYILTCNKLLYLNSLVLLSIRFGEKEAELSGPHIYRFGLKLKNV